MRPLLILSVIAAVLGLAFWAYSENYRTQGELKEVRALRAEILDLRESLGVLRAEWAYLNRPDRLRELADINFERLQLLPLDLAQFGEVTEVSYPQIGLADALDPIDTSAAIEAALSEAAE
jgi:hypothetical protein